MANRRGIDKGILQLAQRSGQYRYINADVIYDGEEVNYNRITGMMEIKGEAASEKIVGYFAYFQLLNGFEKAVYWTKGKVEAHAKRFSKAYNKPGTPWQEHFDAMALKTVLKQLISKYGIMSVEMASVISDDDTADRIEAEVKENANGEAVVIPATLEEPAPEAGDPDLGEDVPDEEPAPEGMASEPDF